MNPPNDSPLALRFEEAIQPSAFLAQIRISAENQAKRELGNLGNTAFKTALNAAKFVLDNNGMHVAFEGGIPAGAKLLRDKTGKALATLVDGKSNILKNARELSKGAKAAKIGIGALLAVVEVAHVISGYDNAQRLKSVEGIGGALLHAHRSELKSELEAIYRHSKGLMSGGLNQLSEHDQRMLHDQCQTLMKLRAQWRADFKHRLAGIKSAEAGWLDTLLRRKEEGLQKDREAKARAVLDAIEIVQLMHFSLMLQMALAGAAGRMEEFREAILPDECHDWRELKEFSLKRACEICGYTYCQPVEFLPFLDAVSDLTRFWSPDRWSKEQSRVVRERETPKTKKEDTPE